MMKELRKRAAGCGRLWRVDDVIGWIINWVAVYRER